MLSFQQSGEKISCASRRQRLRLRYADSGCDAGVVFGDERCCFGSSALEGNLE